MCINIDIRLFIMNIFYKLFRCPDKTATDIQGFALICGNFIPFRGIAGHEFLII